MEKAALVSFFVLILGVSISTQDQIWKELSTTFGITSDKQPRTVADAEAAGWTRLNGCDDMTYFTGQRYLAPRDSGIPDMMLLYDSMDIVAGMQSVIPQSELTFECDGSVNEWYVQEDLNNITWCLTTAYFVPPSSICGDGEMKDELSFQKGKTWDEENLWKAPEFYDDAANSDEWVVQNYFVGMGHHFIPPYPDPVDCNKIAPFQILFAQTSLTCYNSGFVWQHSSSTPARDGWEKPPKAAVEMILSHPPQCILDGADAGTVTTMHVFMGGSTFYCLL